MSLKHEGNTWEFTGTATPAPWIVVEHVIFRYSIYTDIRMILTYIPLFFLRIGATVITLHTYLEKKISAAIGSDQLVEWSMRVNLTHWHVIVILNVRASAGKVVKPFHYKRTRTTEETVCYQLTTTAQFQLLVSHCTDTHTGRYVFSLKTFPVN
jgi:hypothetical protein